MPKPLHWSDSEKCRVLKVIRKFLLEREKAVTDTIQEEFDKVEFIPVCFDQLADEPQTEEPMRADIELDPDVEEYMTAEEDNEFDLIVSISNSEEAELA